MRQLASGYISAGAGAGQGRGGVEGLELGSEQTLQHTQESTILLLRGNALPRYASEALDRPARAPQAKMATLHCNKCYQAFEQGGITKAVSTSCGHLFCKRSRLA